MPLFVQAQVSPDRHSTVIEMSQDARTVPNGISDTKTTIQSAPNRDCCDIVPQEKAPGCWKKMTPCQRKLVCCGGVAATGGAIGGTLYGTGALSALGSLGAVGVVIGICCTIKLAFCGFVCYAKCCKNGKE